MHISELPWAFLTSDWTIRLLSHVGHVEKVDHYGSGLPLQPYLRALVTIDLTQPLLPGCFLPLEDNCVIWIYFRYEGIFKFCKECGFVVTTRVGVIFSPMMPTDLFNVVSKSLKMMACRFSAPTKVFLYILIWFVVYRIGFFIVIHV